MRRSILQLPDPEGARLGYLTPFEYELGIDKGMVLVA